MSVDQWRTLDVVERIERGEMTIAEGATALGLSKRQMKRIRKRVRAEGHQGVVHKNTGRPPIHKTPDAIASRVIALRLEKYIGFNDQHFLEKLVEFEGIDLSRSTVGRILRRAGIKAVRTRRAPKHRRRRDRRPQEGQMILWDGSRHDWLEDRGPFLCLMAAIDDATGRVLPGAHFVDQEGTIGYLRVLRAIVTECGVPLTAYMDRHGALKRNDRQWSKEEQRRGRQEPTQVKRALDDLGIQVLYALSPQAKGRIERLWGTFQDRLVSELRLAAASTVSQANRVLSKYVAQHNARFAVAAAQANSAWRPRLSGYDANCVCALQYVRIVANNNSVRIGGQIIDIPKRGGRRPTYARAEVIVRHQLDGRYRIYFGDEMIGQAQGKPPIEPEHEPRSFERARRQRAKRWQNKQGVTDSLTA